MPARCHNPPARKQYRSYITIASRRIRAPRRADTLDDETGLSGSPAECVFSVGRRPCHPPRRKWAPAAFMPAHFHLGRPTGYGRQVRSSSAIRPAVQRGSYSSRARTVSCSCVGSTGVLGDLYLAHDPAETDAKVPSVLRSDADPVRRFGPRSMDSGAPETADGSAGRSPCGCSARSGAWEQCVQIADNAASQNGRVLGGPLVPGTRSTSGRGVRPRAFREQRGVEAGPPGR